MSTTLRSAGWHGATTGVLAQVLRAVAREYELANAATTASTVSAGDDGIRYGADGGARRRATDTATEDT